MELVYACCVIALGWFWGGMLSGICGVGAVMVAMPLTTFALSSSESILLSSLVGMYSSVHLGVAYRHSCVWSDIRPLVVGVVPGCVLGALVLKIAPAQILQIMISGMLACFMLMQGVRRFMAWTLPESAFLGIVVGIICGFVSSSVTMVGAPLGIYVLLRHWDPDRARGNMSVIYIFTGVGAVVMQATAGLYHADLFSMALAGVVACAGGQSIGIRLGRHLDQRLFRMLLILFLGASALVLFAQALGHVSSVEGKAPIIVTSEPYFRDAFFVELSPPL